MKVFIWRTFSFIIYLAMFTAIDIFFDEPINWLFNLGLASFITLLLVAFDIEFLR